jgi:uncharacterized protein
MSVAPMFPLGMVHFPGVMLPLRVFEPRYRQLTMDCLDGDRRFGVVLIERGSEVGGGDVRTGVGTMTTIVDAGFDDRGMVRLETVGTGRIRVQRWLDDDPYPRAELTELPDPSIGAAEEAARAAVEPKVRRALAMRAELGEPSMPHTIGLDPDPVRGLFQLAAVAPIGPLDQQRLLAALDALELIALLDGFMTEQIEVLEARVAGG